jgi:hypothetical protein
MPLNNLDACLSILKQQGISVSPPSVGENGFIFDVMGFMLTGEQIVTLHEYGRLNAQGIRAFAKSVEGRKDASKILPDPAKL